MCERKKWRYALKRHPDARTVVIEVRADDRSVLDALSGTHRVQRVPRNDTRKHTSTASIAVLDRLDEPVVDLRETDLRIDTLRGSGRGGQRRNKVETAVRITHIPSGLVVTRLSGRSQFANIAEAKAELVQKLEKLALTKQTAVTSDQRAKQVNSERSGKDFTHCWYRDEVVRHCDGAHWSIRQWKQGKFA